MKLFHKLLVFIILTSGQSLADDVTMTFFPDTAKEKGVKGVLTKSSSSEKFVADSENKYDVYEFVMSEFQKEDFKPIKSIITNYTTGNRLNVNFTVGCRDGEYIVMGLKPDAHVLVWENPNENPDPYFSDLE